MVDASLTQPKSNIPSPKVVGKISFLLHLCECSLLAKLKGIASVLNFSVPQLVKNP